MNGSWPLVGRAAQLAQIQPLLQPDQRQGSLLLAGPAGAGKTRLAVEFLALAEGTGWATARVTASKAASELPLGAFAPLLPFGDGPVGGGMFELLRRSAHALAQRAGGRPLALLVDDAHHLDSASATLTHQIVSSRTAFVVATLRSGEPVPDAVTALWKDGLALRVDVPPLDEAGVGALLSAALGGPPDTPTLRSFAVQSGGNPLFLRELVLCAMDAGALHRENGIWQLTGPIRASSRLVELVEARLGSITDVERIALEAVAYGEPLGVRFLDELADRAALEGLERRNLLAVNRAGQRLEARLAHPLYGDVLRQSIGPLRADALRRQLADAVEATGARRRDDILRVATWRLDGGGRLKPELMFRAAERARARCDFTLARRLATASVGAGGGFEPALLVAELLQLTGHCAEAERDLALLASQASDDRQRGRVAVIRCDNLWYGLERLQDAMAVAEEAEAAIADPDLRDEMAARRISLLRATGDMSATLRLSEDLLVRARGRALAWTCVVAGVVHIVSGHVERALELADRGQVEHVAFRGPALAWDASVHVWVRCHALSWAGRLADAEAAARREYEVALTEGSAATKAYLVWELARIGRLQGRVATAERWAREGVAIQRGMGWPNYLLPVCLAELAHTLALAGRHRDAAAALDEITPTDHQRSPQFWGTLAEARAWTKVAAGDVGGAVADLEHAAARAAGRGERLIEASMLHDLIRLGVARPAGRLRALAEVTDSPMVGLAADHAAAWAAADPSGLLEVSYAFGDIGANLLAAEAAAQSAHVQRRSHGGREAARADRRIALLRGRCEDAVTPALALAGTGPAHGLTSREHQVALLAGAGRSNRDIATELCLSVRTVENQLQRAYEKLGVAGRGELAAALGQA